MRAIFANAGIVWSFEEILIVIVIVCAVLAIAYAAVTYFKIPIPAVVFQIFGIILVAAIAILGIRFLFSL